jgi:hypothetical protein
LDREDPAPFLMFGISEVFMRNSRPVQFSVVICAASLALSGCGWTLMNVDVKGGRKQIGTPGPASGHLDAGEIGNPAQGPDAEEEAPPRVNIPA